MSRWFGKGQSYWVGEREEGRGRQWGQIFELKVDMRETGGELEVGLI
jgi:hypothetical protein